VTRTVAIRGSGTAELAAYGLADAEHRVEKELRALWPAARVEVIDVSRRGPPGRIVEEFLVRYRVSGTEAVIAGDAAESSRLALRVARERFAGSRFERIHLEAAPPDAPD
jgi:hypothetical protein